jgi:hypothetical protein
MLTLAPATTAPPESVTLPVIRPVATWAESCDSDAASSKVQAIKARTLTSFIVFIYASLRTAITLFKSTYYQLFTLHPELAALSLLFV